MTRQKRDFIQLSYIENGPYLKPEASRLRKEIYDVWFKEWGEIYKSWKSNNIPSWRDFMLYQIIHCVTINGKVAGMTAHRFMHLDEPLNAEMEYFQSFGLENVAKMQEMGIQKILTFESLLVEPAFRKTHQNIHLSKLLFYLANQIFSLSHVQGLIGTARRDVKVPQLGLSMGYEVLEADRKVRVIPCDILLQRNKEIVQTEDPTWVLSRRLWNERRTFLSEPGIANAILIRAPKTA